LCKKRREPLGEDPNYGNSLSSETEARPKGQAGEYRATACACLRRQFSGEPEGGNLHIRFDEGRGAVWLATSLTLLLYRLG